MSTFDLNMGIKLRSICPTPKIIDSDNSRSDHGKNDRCHLLRSLGLSIDRIILISEVKGKIKSSGQYPVRVKYTLNFYAAKFEKSEE